MPSWLRLSRASKPLSVTSPTSATSPAEELLALDSTDVVNLDAQAGRLRPIQFAPSRLATLYISRSERDLYMAAMDTLDANPPPLPLWSEPPPALPPVVRGSDAIGWRPPTLLSMGPAAAAGSLPSPRYPQSPKLVTSPDGAHGLLVRDEFRRVPPRSTPHALLTLSLPSGLRFRNFPVPALLAVDEAVRATWPHGVVRRAESVESLGKRTDDAREGMEWGMTLGGTAWSRKGHQELESIRLLLAILTALGVNGWYLVDNLQAASKKKDSHNLLFAYSPDTAAMPPLFFAVTLPYRISLISPPPRSTPALISAIRSAILAQNGTGHMRGATGDTVASGTTAGPASAGNGVATHDDNGKRNGGLKAVVWGKKGGIKLEGWVHPGVYRFWMGGMRRFPGGRLKTKVVDAVHPPLVLAIVDTLSTLHFSLVASLPLLPLLKGRDVLIFSSLPTSGLTHKDGYIVDRQSLLVPDDAALSAMAPPPTEPAATQPTHLTAPAADPPTRVLPWQSIAEAGHRASEDRADEPPPTAGPVTRSRAPPRESQRRMMSPSPGPGASPRRHNVLLKKSSVRRRTISGGAGTGGVGASGRHSRQGSASEVAPLNQPRSHQDSGEWEYVAAPDAVDADQLLHDAPELGGAAATGTAPLNAAVPPDRDHEQVVYVAPGTVATYAPRPSQDTTHSGHSMYTDAGNDYAGGSESGHDSVGRGDGGRTLALGGPMRDSEPILTVPIHDSSAAAARLPQPVPAPVPVHPAARGISSSHGSVGYFGSVRSGREGAGTGEAEGRRSEDWAREGQPVAAGPAYHEAGAVPPPLPLPQRGELGSAALGQGGALGTVNGAGSARTKIAFD